MGRKESNKKYRDKNRDRCLQYGKKYREENKEYFKEYFEKYNNDNYFELKKYRQEYCKSNKEKINKYKKEWNRKNCLKIKEHNLQYYKFNKKEINKKFLDKLHSNPRVKIKHYISCSIRNKLKRRMVYKISGKDRFDFLPYTVDDLFKHLESKFRLGMSWKNYGLRGWHIDHILPDSSFNYKSVEDEEFQKCWALDNLQPLWAEENWSKNNKIL